MATADLAALLNQAAQSRNVIRCRTCKTMADIGPEDAAALSAALSDPDMSSTMIARALTNYGVSVSPSAVSRHRRECR